MELKGEAHKTVEAAVPVAQAIANLEVCIAAALMVLAATFHIYAHQYTFSFLYCQNIDSTTYTTMILHKQDRIELLILAFGYIFANLCKFAISAK